jgi:Gamma interferon inducible lysosomal thiol reductase (GILT)
MFHVCICTVPEVLIGNWPTMTLGALPKISAACLVVATILCLVCSFLDPSYQPERQSQGGTPPLFSMLYQARLPLKGSIKGHDTYGTKTFTGTETETDTIPPVQVLLCVEALCIDSKNFFHDQLMVAFNALGHTVMNLTVVSFGNAKISEASHKITCQHGFGECDTNSYEQCAVHLYPDPAQHVPYLACLFASLPMGHRDEPFDQSTGLEPCAHSNNLSFDDIKACHDDAILSWKLQTLAAKDTPTRHDHVPWVQINGQYMDEESHNLIQEVCKAYQQAGGHTAGCSAFDE